MKKELSQEEKLLLAIIKGEIPEDLKEINWNNFLALTRRARVSAYIYFCLKEDALSYLFPPEIVSSLGKDLYENFSRNSLIQNFIGELFREIKGKVEILPLKGIVFMEKLYSHPGLRPISDVDLLIREEEYGKLEKILKDYQGELLYRKPYAAVFSFKEPLRINLDLSLNLLAIKRFIKVSRWTDKELWQRVEKEKICSQEVFLLSKEDTLFHLIYHQAFQHCFRNFLGYLDMTCLINQGSINWDIFLERIINLGLSGVAKKELGFLRDYLGAKIPENVLPPHPESLAFQTGDSSPHQKFWRGDKGCEKDKFLRKAPPFMAGCGGLLALKERSWSRTVFQGFSEMAPENLSLSCPHLFDWLRQPFFWDRFIQVGKSFFYSFFSEQNWLKEKIVNPVSKKTKL